MALSEVYGPDKMARAIEDAFEFAASKYWIKETRAGQRSRELLFAVIRTLSQLAAEPGLKTVGWKDYQELEDERLARLDESIFESAHFLADLMAIDGALVLTAAWDVIGFGAEIQGPSSRNEVVYRALALGEMQAASTRGFLLPPFRPYTPAEAE
jgi:hypothetical protein